MGPRGELEKIVVFKLGLLQFSAAGSGARKAKGGSSEGKMSRREEGKGIIGKR